MAKQTENSDTTRSPEPASSDAASMQAATDAALDAASDAAPAAAPDAASRANELNDLRKRAAERDELLSLLQHVRADYANYQKRAQKEIDATRRFATQPLVLDLLPVIDNLERALQSTDAGGPANGLIDGIRLVHQQLLASLTRHGVRPVAAAGLPFNPEIHEALMEQPAPDKPPRTVLQELEKGYALHDRVIRPAKVIVSTANQSAPTAASTEPAKSN